MVKALYHRDYQEREPIEITVEPTHIDILSYTGPDCSISAKSIKAAKKLKSRSYRNRRLRDSLMTIPCREDMVDAATLPMDDNEKKNFDDRLLQILGQSFVQVQESVYQSNIIDTFQLLQILEQLSVKVWDKSKK